MLAWELDHFDGFTRYTRGCEVHVDLRRPGVVTRRTIREFFAPVLDKHGMATTRALRGDPRLDRFLKRIGFNRSWSDDHYDYYILTAMPFTKEEKCQ